MIQITPVLTAQAILGPLTTRASHKKAHWKKSKIKPLTRAHRTNLAKNATKGAEAHQANSKDPKSLVGNPDNLD